MLCARGLEVIGTQQASVCFPPICNLFLHLQAWVQERLPLAMLTERGSGLQAVQQHIKKNQVRERQREKERMNMDENVLALVESRYIYIQVRPHFNQ
jgi:hypothetical protein